MNCCPDFVIRAQVRHCNVCSAERRTGTSTGHRADLFAIGCRNCCATSRAGSTGLRQESHPFPRHLGRVFDLVHHDVEAGELWTRIICISATLGDGPRESSFHGRGGRVDVITVKAQSSF